MVSAYSRSDITLVPRLIGLVAVLPFMLLSIQTKMPPTNDVSEERVGSKKTEVHKLSGVRYVRPEFRNLYASLLPASNPDRVIFLSRTLTIVQNVTGTNEEDIARIASRENDYHQERLVSILSCSCLSQPPDPIALILCLAGASANQVPHLKRNLGVTVVAIGPTCGMRVNKRVEVLGVVRTDSHIELKIVIWRADINATSDIPYVPLVISHLGNLPSGHWTVSVGWEEASEHRPEMRRQLLVQTAAFIVGG